MQSRFLRRAAPPETEEREEQEVGVSQDAANARGGWVQIIIILDVRTSVTAQLILPDNPVRSEATGRSGERPGGWPCDAPADTD